MTLKPMRLIAPLSLLALVACSQPPSTTPVAGAPSCKPTNAALNAAGTAATNRARSAAGLPQVRANTLLAQVAADHACDMARRGQMTHRGSSTSGPAERVKARGYDTRITAENIAAGPFDTRRVLSEWQKSPGHRANILLPQVDEFGIGRAVSADGRTQYWAAVYAAEK
ncbi:CAP domain-containing protein [Paracoccus indicus]|uniref:CAP domain-containing protein n=1 Tax=Paracoccus indicus TaxID=2079229 RepID=UPI000D376233|nr:CAP domain-containing protein [Paracoccus indicus]